MNNSRMKCRCCREWMCDQPTENTIKQRGENGIGSICTDCFADDNLMLQWMRWGNFGNLEWFMKNDRVPESVKQRVGEIKKLYDENKRELLWD